MQIPLPGPHQQPNQPHPNPQRTKRQPDPGLENFRGLAASGSQHFRWSPSWRLRKQYTHTTPTATRNPGVLLSPSNPASTGQNGPSGRQTAVHPGQLKLCSASPGPCLAAGRSGPRWAVPAVVSGAGHAARYTVTVMSSSGRHGEFSGRSCRRLPAVAGRRPGRLRTRGRSKFVRHARRRDRRPRTRKPRRSGRPIGSADKAADCGDQVMAGHIRSPCHRGKSPRAVNCRRPAGSHPLAAAPTGALPAEPLISQRGCQSRTAHQRAHGRLVEGAEDSAQATLSLSPCHRYAGPVWCVPRPVDGPTSAATAAVSAGR